MEFPLPFDFKYNDHGDAHSCAKIKVFGPNRTFLHRHEVVACIGGEDTRRKATTGRLSGRGRESTDGGYTWRNASEKMSISNIFNINMKQFLSLISFLHLVPEALIKHFALIQRLKIIASLNEMAKCRKYSYEKHET